MEWEQILSELVGFVKEAAPALWAIYRRQLIVESVQYGLWMFVSAFVGAVLFRCGKRAVDSNEYDADILAVFSYSGSAMLMALSVAFACSIIGRLINPDYYVIQMMLSAIGAR